MILFEEKLNFARKLTHKLILIPSDLKTEA
jgi:hypothetical protein